MFPRLADDDTSDGFSAQAVFLCGLRLRQLAYCNSAADGADLLFRQFSGMTLFATRGIGAALCPHISHVVRLCAKKEVGDVDALRVVAGVEDAGAVRDRTVGVFPEDVAYEDHPFAGDFRFDDGPTVAVCAAGPDDAAVSDRRAQSSADAVEDGDDAGFVATGYGAKPSNDIRPPSGPYLYELVFTAFADTINCGRLTRHADPSFQGSVCGGGAC